MQVANYFDQVYSEHDRYWWRDKDPYALDADCYPYSLLTQLTLRLIKGRPAGRALDLGAGEGADSIRLSRLGYQVESVDISPVAATKIRRAAERAGVPASVAVADVATYEPSGCYDLVICNGVLHYVEDKETVIRRMQAATSGNGLNIISLWSSYTPVPACHDAVPVFCDDEYGVVAKLYAQWNAEFLYFDRDKPETAHADLPAHRHSHIKLIARKPAAG